MIETLRAGIIAAGHGSRLSAVHPGLLKPLIPVAGSPLCHWVVQSLRRAGITEFTMLLNSRGREVGAHLQGAFPDFSWRFIERDTASSWESFRLVARTLARERGAFLISTVDALVPPRQLMRFVSAMREASCAAGLALTDFVDDEKPLWADLDEGGRVTALGARAKTKSHVTCGLYYLTAELAARMPAARAYGSLREYWADLVRGETRVGGVLLAKTLDVDRPEDIPQAEEFVKAGGRDAW